VVLAPKVQFVERGAAHLAYQVYGDGPARVVYIAGIPTHREQIWQFPVAVRSLERQARLARIAMYDLRGFGMSDALPAGGYPIEEAAADALAVWDAAGFERAVVRGNFIGGAVAVWLAVHRPERVEGLILYDATACTQARPGYEIGLAEPEMAQRRAVIQSLWGTGATTIGMLAPSMAGDERLVEEWARYERQVATPTSIVVAVDVAAAWDVRDLLPQVAAPTMVLHSVTNGLYPVTHGRYLAEHILGALYIEIADDIALEWKDESFADVAEFLTGSRAAAHIDRSLQVLLFTDIVDSTNRAAAMGDNAWRDLLADFRGAVRRVLERYDAREVNTRGDDFFAVVGSPSVAIDVARSIRHEAAALGLDVRSGLHLGEVEHQANDFAGLAVHIGARIQALAEPREILVSQTVRDALIGSDIAWASRGHHHLKGVPGEWQLFAIEN
jgi:pimeloyl-ACP methyl ester carboxylesterase